MTILEPCDLVAVAASPLLNLGAARATTAGLVHHARLHGPDGAALPGRVTLRLSGGGACLTVSVRSAGVSPRQVGLARVVGSEGPEGLLLCVLKNPQPSGGAVLGVRSESLRTFGVDADTAGAALIEGMTFRSCPDRVGSSASHSRGISASRIGATHSSRLMSQTMKSLSNCQ